MKAFFVLSFIGLATLQAKYLQVGKPRPFYNATNALKSTFGENKQHLRCYDGPNQTGNYIDIDTDAVSDLSKAPYNFNDKIVSCDLNGIYFLYENYNFNPNLNVSFVSKCPPGISLRALGVGSSLCPDVGRQPESQYECLCFESVLHQADRRT